MKISKGDWESSSKVERVREYFSRPRLVHLRAEYLIHERVDVVDDSVRCACCGSAEARIFEREDGPQVLIDRVRGTRKIRDEFNAVRFDQIAAKATYVYLPIRCTRQQAAIFHEQGRRVVMLSGGNRAGKTTSAENWLLLRWLRRGGRRRKFWVVSHELQQAFDVAARMVHGEADHPRVLPAEVVRSMPTSVRSKDPKVVLIDGSVIELRHTNKTTGGNLKGKAVVDILWDEAVETPSPAVYTVLVNRLTGSRGTMLCSTTPLPGHFLKKEVVDEAHTAHPDGTTSGSPLKAVHYLRMRDNVWYSRQGIEDSYASCRDETTRRRECDGEWLVGEGRLWTFWSPDRMQIWGEHRTLEERGLADVTEAAVRLRWPGENPFVRGLRPPSRIWYVGGQDFNCVPMSLVIAQIEGDPDAPADRSKWRLWIWDESVVKRTNTRAFAEHVASSELADVCGWKVSRYAKMPILCDASGCYTDPTRHRMARARAAPTARTSAAEIMSEGGFDCRPCHLNENKLPENPRIRARVDLLHRLMREDRIRVHSRCKYLLKAIDEQEDDGRGVPVKESHHASDRLSGPIDAAGYLAWGIFAEPFDRQGGGFRRSFADA
jgi:hypothetical protein